VGAGQRDEFVGRRPGRCCRVGARFRAGRIDPDPTAVSSAAISTFLLIGDLAVDAGSTTNRYKHERETYEGRTVERAFFGLSFPNRPNFQLVSGL
jgi:hypothetical protein